MKGLVKVMLTVTICLGISFICSSLRADEFTDLAQELIDEGMSADSVSSLFSGPADTLGQRAQAMLNNGSITQRQYDKLNNKFLSLPQQRRQAVKNAYDKGGADKLYDLTRGAAARKLNVGDDTSLRNHVRDLKQQGLTRDQVKERLRNEGVSADKLKDLGYGPAEPSRREHAKDRGHDEDARIHAKDKRDLRKDVDRQGRTDKGKAWWKFWESDEGRAGAKDKAHEREGVRQGGKRTRDTRKDVRQQENQTRRGRR